MAGKSLHIKNISWLLCAGVIQLFVSGPAAAQEPPVKLQLLAWPPDSTFLIGATPGQVVTLPDGSTQPFDPNLFPSIPVTQAGDPPGHVVVSPDGKKRAILVNEFFMAQLWVGHANEPAHLVLNSEGEIFSDLSWRPDGEALALIRTPLGSQTDSSGELWRVDLADNAAIRLSRNNAVDRSPVWSADGTTLAVIRNERLMFVPANQPLIEEFVVDEPAITSPPALPIGAQAQLTPPATIRVIHHASNTCRAVPVGQIDTIPFEEYVKRVVPYEVYPSWPAETLKAQAVAARTYGWDKYLQNPGASYHVTDWVNHQYMCDNTFASTNQAVDGTAGEYLAYNGQPITAMFSAENSSPTKNNTNVNYLLAVDDPVSFGQTRNGHGYGMGQWGAQRWAAWHNWSYQAILRHYYSNVTLEESAADTMPPNVAIVTPWSNHYLTGNKLRLFINTSDDSGVIQQTNVYLSTPSETNLLISQAGPANSAGYVVDISTWADQPLTATLVLTAEAIDGGGQRGQSPPVTIGTNRIAPSGWLTTATTLTPTTVITDWPVVSLTLSGPDATAGATHIAMGRKDWEWEGENLIRQEVGGQPVGQVISDAAALNGQAMQATVAADPAGTWSSSPITLPAPQQYRAYFRLKVSDTTVSGQVARLEVIDNQSGSLIGLHRLYGTDFRSNNVYQEFHADFNHPTAVPLIFRLVFLDSAGIALDRVVLLEYPVAYTTTPSYNALNFRLKVIDGAGNVSEDLLVLPAISFDNQVYLPILNF